MLGHLMRQGMLALRLTPRLASSYGFDGPLPVGFHANCRNRMSLSNTHDHELDIPVTARFTERLSKRIARSGVCSRRDAEKMIANNRVSVDGTVINEQGVKTSFSNVVRIDGKLLPEVEPRLFVHHKMKGTIVTHHDPLGRVSVFDQFRRMRLPYLSSVGRLDFASEGLLLLTNYPPLAELLEHPANAFERTYAVRVRGHLTREKIRVIRSGMKVGATHYQPMSLLIPDHFDDKKTKWLTLGLQEGKKREIRTVLSHLDLDVLRLKRIGYGPYKLGKLEPGAVSELEILPEIAEKSTDPWLRQYAHQSSS